jgi:hypothetical protein
MYVCMYSTNSEATSHMLSDYSLFHLFSITDASYERNYFSCFLNLFVSLIFEIIQHV